MTTEGSRMKQPLGDKVWVVEMQTRYRGPWEKWCVRGSEFSAETKRKALASDSSFQFRVRPYMLVPGHRDS